MKSVEKDTPAWKAFYDSSSPHLEKPPAPYTEVKGLSKLVILRALRPDKLVPAIQVCPDFMILLNSQLVPFCLFECNELI